ncbi:hypothetical protein MSG28_013139 [Choristoneura fumiferana]|uniref:Uncharacterized protein n=1 Tax=Choristoneura fumiferana TaxID=7141 RepID=A0ACC0KS11_CHOFU|nr:hypothetical protein MSG28_013139 [Choristoneura fumiferana]
MASRVWWLAAALIASVCHTALAEYVTWPGCSSSYEVIEVGKINHNVTDLDLSDCNLTTTNLAYLRYYPNLKVLFLDSNKISQIEAGAFDSLTKLHYLQLKHNTFLGRDLPAHLFRNWHSSVSILIHFGDNNMTDTPDDLLQGLNLYELILKNCSLREFPSFVKRPVLENMLSLDLEHNLISRLDDPNTFANNINLEVLFISNNNIDFLHADLLKPLAKIEDIYMKNNRIRIIPDGFFHNKASLSTVSLANNLIEYLPANAFLGTRLGFLSVSGNKLSHLPANFLSELQTKGPSAQNKDYGDGSLKPDLDEETYNKSKEHFLSKLQKSDEENNKFKKHYIPQSESGDWMELRRSLLTASNFGKIIKRRDDTSCASTLGIDIKRFGLFIDKELPYLGATPDGIRGDDTVIEVKCPITAHGIGVEEVILKKQITFWKINKNELIDPRQKLISLGICLLEILPISKTQSRKKSASILPCCCAPQLREDVRVQQHRA